MLESEGVGLAIDGSIRHLEFGTDIETISAVLAKSLGPVTRTVMPECGQGARVQLTSQGFIALFRGTTFVGWTDSGRGSVRLTTVSGIGVGSKLAEIRAAYARTTVTEGSLGPEWNTPDGSLGGLLDGTTPASRMTTFYAGETCFFR